LFFFALHLSCFGHFPLTADEQEKDEIVSSRYGLPIAAKVVAEI
jgi:hypothetical protein